MDNQYKIVIIGPAFPLRGGIASFNERLALELQNNGHNVNIFTFSLQYPSFLFPGKTQFSEDEPPAGIDIKVLINSINPFNWIKIGLSLRKEKPDFVIVRFWLPFMAPCLGSIIRIIKGNQHTKILCIADNIIPHEKRFGDRALTAYFIRSIDGFITMSENVLEHLRSFSRSTPAINIPHPLFDNFGTPVARKLARQHLNLPEDRQIILFFGFIRKYKGLDILLEAMGDKRIRESGIILLVAGEFYQDDKPYLELIEKLGIKENVVLHTSFIDHDEVRYFCSAADVIVQPYRNATQSGVTPLAYHFNKPMIVTNVGGLPQMVEQGKTGLVAEPNPLSIADRIVEYFKLGEDHFLDNIQIHKKKLSWESFAFNVIKLYKDLLK